MGRRRHLVVLAAMAALAMLGAASARAQITVSGSGATPPPSLVAYRGMAAWVDIFHTGVTSSERPLIRRFLSQAHLDGMRVVAWYLPPLTDPATEYQQALTAI